MAGWPLPGAAPQARQANPAGGPDSCTGRLWKHELAVLAEESGLEITIMHFPPGTVE